MWVVVFESTIVEEAVDDDDKEEVDTPSATDECAVEAENFLFFMVDGVGG